MGVFLIESVPTVHVFRSARRQCAIKKTQDEIKDLQTKLFRVSCGLAHWRSWWASSREWKHWDQEEQNTEGDELDTEGVKLNTEYREQSTEGDELDTERVKLGTKYSEQSKEGELIINAVHGVDGQSAERMPASSLQDGSNGPKGTARVWRSGRDVKFKNVVK